MNLNFDAILGECEELGACLLWPHSLNGGRRPQVHHEGRMVQIRPLVYVHKHGKTPKAGLRVVASCGDLRCIAPAHMVAWTAVQIGRRAADQGKFSSPQRIAAITAAMRSGHQVKLSPDLVREIRHSEESGQVIANRLGISKSLALRVRRGDVWRETTRGASIFNL